MMPTSLPRDQAFVSVLLLVAVLAGCNRQSSVKGESNAAEVSSEIRPVPVSIPPSWARVVLPPWGNGSPGITIALPPGFSSENNKGHDFDVHQIRGPEDTGVLSIYVGHHPNRGAIEGAETLRKPVGNRMVEFARRETEYGTFTDAIVHGFFDGDGDEGVSELMLHVFIHAKDSSFYDTAWTMLASISKQNQSEQGAGGNGGQAR